MFWFAHHVTNLQARSHSIGAERTREMHRKLYELSMLANEYMGLKVQKNYAALCFFEELEEDEDGEGEAFPALDGAKLLATDSS